MTKNMTVVSKSTEDIQSPSFEKGWALFIPKRKYLYHIERKVRHHFEVTVNRHSEERVNRHFEEIAIIISKRLSAIISKGQGGQSFQNDSLPSMNHS